MSAAKPPLSLPVRALRRLLRIAYPEYEAQHDMLASLRLSLGKVHAELDQQRLRNEELSTAAARSMTALATADDVRALRRQMTEMKRRQERQHRTATRMLRRGEARTEDTREERTVLQRLERIAAGSRPILVGPWSGEVGFELLYWIPFVRWFQEKYDVDPQRLIVMSRGGVGAWYSHISRKYVETFDHITADEFRDATLAVKKQRGVTQLDLRLLRRAVRGERLGRVDILHPAAMYRLFWQFWKQNVSVKRVDRYTHPVPLAADDRVDLPPGLPADFVAVRFYFSNCFPDTPDNRAFAASVVRTLAASVDVVLLNTPVAVDDHADQRFDGDRRIHLIGDMPLQRNLAIQTAVLRRARLFVGTYGGYAYLAPLLGVPSVAFHSNGDFFQHHLDLAHRVFESIGTPSLVTLSTGDAALLRLALATTPHNAVAAP